MLLVKDIKKIIEKYDDNTPIMIEAEDGYSFIHTNRMKDVRFHTASGWGIGDVLDKNCHYYRNHLIGPEMSVLVLSSSKPQIR